MCRPCSGVPRRSMSLGQSHSGTESPSNQCSVNRRACVPSSPGRGALPARWPGPSCPVSVPHGPLLSQQTCRSLPRRERGSSLFMHLSQAAPLTLTTLQFRTAKSKRLRKLRSHLYDDPFPITPRKVQSVTALTDPRKHQPFRSVSLLQLDANCS